MLYLERTGLPDSTAKKTHRPIIGGERFVLLRGILFEERIYWCTTAFGNRLKLESVVGGWCVGRILIEGVVLQAHPCGFWMMEYI